MAVIATNLEPSFNIKSREHMHESGSTSLLKQIKITRVETRPNDAWYDLSLRQLRKGEVRFYRIRDFLTGSWLFKICRDKELGKVLVKAVKCPAGIRFSQLEGNTMVFQKSVFEGWLYDVISLTQIDEEDRVKRRIVTSLEEVPETIRENYRIKSYVQAKGKTAPGKHWVTLSKSEDEKAMITLFLLERAWTLSEITPEEKLETMREHEKELSSIKIKKEFHTGEVWRCPICDAQHRLVHIETEKAVRHALKKMPLTSEKHGAQRSDR